MKEKEKARQPTSPSASQSINPFSGPQGARPGRSDGMGVRLSPRSREGAAQDRGPVSSHLGFFGPWTMSGPSVVSAPGTQEMTSK